MPQQLVHILEEVFILEAFQFKQESKYSWLMILLRSWRSTNSINSLSPPKLIPFTIQSGTADGPPNCFTSGINQGSMLKSLLVYLISETSSRSTHFSYSRLVFAFPLIEDP